MSNLDIIGFTDSVMNGMHFGQATLSTTLVKNIIYQLHYDKDGFNRYMGNPRFPFTN